MTLRMVNVMVHGRLAVVINDYNKTELGSFVINEAFQGNITSLLNDNKCVVMNKSNFNWSGQLKY